MCRKEIRADNKKTGILLVTNCIPRYFYRCQEFLNHESIDYFNWQQQFVNALSEKNRNYLRVRLYVSDYGQDCLKMWQDLNPGGLLAFDLRGHGKSEGERAFIGSFDLLLQDLERFIAFVRQKEINKAIFLLGHSAGGSIIALSAINNKLPDIKGAILSAPVLKLNTGLPFMTAFFSSFIGYFLPRMKLNKLNARLLSQDPEVISSYLKDPLVYKEGLFAGVLSEFIRTINMIQAQMEAVTIPLLILHGTKDYFADIKGSKQLYDRSCSKDKTLNLYDNFYHELFNEPEKEKVFSDITAWLDKRVELKK